MVDGSYTLTETDTEIETENFMELGNGLKPLYFSRPRTVRNFDIRRIILGIGLSVCVGQYELAIHHQVYLYSPTSYEHFLTVEWPLTGSDTVTVPPVVVSPTATCYRIRSLKNIACNPEAKYIIVNTDTHKCGR